MQQQTVQMAHKDGHLVHYKTVTCVVCVLRCIIKNMRQVTISLYVTVLLIIL
jgi:hypothetical protein